MIKIIKREKIKNKYYWVLRNNGKIVEKRPWSSKKEVKKEVFQNAKSDRFSLYKNRTNTKLVNVIEKTRKLELKTYRGVKTFKSPTRKRFAVQITLTEGKQSVVARSDMDINQSKQSKRDQAYKRALGLYNRNVLNLNYEDDESSKLIERGKLKVKEEIIYYAKI